MRRIAVAGSFRTADDTWLVLFNHDHSLLHFSAFEKRGVPCRGSRSLGLGLGSSVTGRRASSKELITSFRNLVLLELDLPGKEKEEVYSKPSSRPISIYSKIR